MVTPIGRKRASSAAIRAASSWALAEVCAASDADEPPNKLPARFTAPPITAGLLNKLADTGSPIFFSFMLVKHR